MNETVVSVKGLKKSFKAFQAVKNVSFSVQKNDVFGFLGPNGAGKSTSLRCMLSLIKADAGEIKLFGDDINWSGVKKAVIECADKYGFEIIKNRNCWRYMDFIPDKVFDNQKIKML